LSQTQFFDGDFEGCIESCKNCYAIYYQYLRWHGTLKKAIRWSVVI